MNMRLSLIFLTMLCFLVSAGQTTPIGISFNAIRNTVPIKLDSIKIINRTQGGETLIHWPDTSATVLINSGDLLLYVGYTTFPPVSVPENAMKSAPFQLFQNVPNPVTDQCLVSMCLAQDEFVQISVSDLWGRTVADTKSILCPGNHTFRFVPGDSPVYLFSARAGDRTQTVRIVSAAGSTGKTCQLEHTGTSASAVPNQAINNESANNMVEESGILDSPSTNSAYVFQFASNIPCPGTPSVTYGGQIYPTVQVFSQCWLTEDLNIGTMINGSLNQSDNGILEKYCYNNVSDSCTKYGGLYMWKEMMQYQTQQGIQGICPSGWHIPTDEEWKVLEGAADRHIGIGNPVWDTESLDRGWDVGLNLRSQDNWTCFFSSPGEDLYGFKGFPNGWESYGNFYDINCFGHWWTSTASNSTQAWFRSLHSVPQSTRHYTTKDNSFGVRCLMDY